MTVVVAVCSFHYEGMDQDETARPSPAGWIEALERSEAQLAAGQVVDGAAMRQRLRDSIARMQAVTLEPDALQPRQ